MNIKTVTVIGANGTMGTNISAIFASFGAAKVYMVSRDIKKAEEALLKASNSVKATSIKNRLVAADYTMLDDCIKKSDLIFEAVFEDVKTKKQIAGTIAKSMNENAIACTGTSGLSVTTISEEFPENLRSRFFGVHMFNPPYNLNLCELIPTKYSDMSLCNEFGEYLKNDLLRTVVLLKDLPAFLGNRIGFQFINEVMQYAEKEDIAQSGGIDYLDSILGQFSGRSMSPLVTADFVGLDIHKAIVDNLYNNTSDYANQTFVLPSFATKLINEGRLGKKTKEGLYKTVIDENGFKIRMVYDICSGKYRKIANYKFDFAEKMKEYIRIGDYQEAFKVLIDDKSKESEICLQFLLKYVVYSVTAAKLVGYDINSADHVMATGFNWCPPFAVADALNLVVDFKELLKERLDDNWKNSVDLDDVISNIVVSKYDYRTFFKAKR